MISGIVYNECYSYYYYFSWWCPLIFFFVIVIIRIFPQLRNSFKPSPLTWFHLWNHTHFFFFSAFQCHFLNCKIYTFSQNALFVPFRRSGIWYLRDSYGFMSLKSLFFWFKPSVVHLHKGIYYIMPSMMSTISQMTMGAASSS